jgi:hypothetical protein
MRVALQPIPFQTPLKSAISHQDFFKSSGLEPLVIWRLVKDHQVEPGEKVAHFRKVIEGNVPIASRHERGENDGGVKEGASEFRVAALRRPKVKGSGYNLIHGVTGYRAAAEERANKQGDQRDADRQDRDGVIKAVPV